MKNVNSIQHKRNSTVNGGNPVYPSSSAIEFGELAINYASSAETLFVKNSEGVVVPFSSDEVYTKKMLGSGFTENTVTQVIENVSGAVTAHTADTDVHVTAAKKAEWDEVSGKVDTSAFTRTMGSGFTVSSVTEVIEEDERITAAALNFLSGSISSSTSELSTLSGRVDYVSGVVDNVKSTYFAGASYDSNSKHINFYNNSSATGSVLAYVDATDFIKDGMVDDVEISGSNLVITFNTDSGKEPISIPLSSIFDPSNYYTTAQTSSATEISDALALKQDVSGMGAYTLTSTTDTLSNTLTAHTADTTIHVTSADKTNWDGKADESYINDKLGSAFTSSTADSVTKVIEDNELAISAALNTLSGAISSSASEVSAITNDVATLSGNVTALSQTVSSKASQSDLNALSGKSITTVSASGLTTGFTTNADGTKNLTLQVANVDGSSVVLNGYTKGSDTSPISATDTVNQAIAKLENQVGGGGGGGLSAITVNSVAATIADKEAIVTIDGDDIILGADYSGQDVTASTTAGTVHLAPITSDTISVAISKLTNEMLDNEEVMAAAANVLSGTIDDVTAELIAHTADTTAHLSSSEHTNLNNALSGYTPTTANTISQLESRIAALESIVANLTNNS